MGELKMANKIEYFEMVDRKREMDAKVQELENEYKEIWWDDDHQAIKKNMKDTDIFKSRIRILLKEMAEYRKDIPKETLKEWKTEYGHSRGLV